MKVIVLISCVSKKLSNKAKVRDLYTSSLFKMNLAYAGLLKPDSIYVLSAKYGLLELGNEIEPYDATLNSMHTHQIKEWANGVIGQLKQISDLSQDKFIFLAGIKYRKYLIPFLSNYVVPMEGLTIGKQLQYLKRKLNE